MPVVYNCLISLVPPAGFEPAAHGWLLNGKKRNIQVFDFTNTNPGFTTGRRIDIHDVVNEIADDIPLLEVCPDKKEIAQKIDELSADRFCRPVLMIGIDGAHAPTRPEPSSRKGKRGKGEWKEFKGFRMYLLDKDAIVHLISWHQIESDKALANDLFEIKQAGLIPEDKVRIGVIGDGAPWIWNRIKQVCPTAKKVLDYYHCSEYLYDLASTQYGKSSQKAQEWVEAMLPVSSAPYSLVAITEDMVKSNVFLLTALANITKSEAKSRAIPYCAREDHAGEREFRFRLP